MEYNSNKKKKGKKNQMNVEDRAVEVVLNGNNTSIGSPTLPLK